MRPRFWVSTQAVLLLMARGAFAQCTAASPCDPASLAAELHRLAAAAVDERSLPREWAVKAPDGSYRISTEPLRNLLGAGAKDPAVAQRQAQIWLNHLARQIESLEQPQRDVSGARSKLDRILARPEFAGARPPSAWDLFRQRIAARIGRIVDDIYWFLRSHLKGSQTIVGTILVAALAIAIAYLILNWRRRNWFPEPAAPSHRGTARNWAQWLSGARRAADAGDWRQAIQFAYWTGIAHLQEADALPKDASRTPREHLAALSRPSSAAEPLAALTSRLERFWYARHEASGGDFRECLVSLEALGCKLD